MSLFFLVYYKLHRKISDIIIPKWKHLCQSDWCLSYFFFLVHLCVNVCFQSELILCWWIFFSSCSQLCSISLLTAAFIELICFFFLFFNWTAFFFVFTTVKYLTVCILILQSWMFINLYLCIFIYILFFVHQFCFFFLLWLLFIIQSFFFWYMKNKNNKMCIFKIYKYLLNNWTSDNVF